MKRWRAKWKFRKEDHARNGRNGTETVEATDRNTAGAIVKTRVSKSLTGMNTEAVQSCVEITSIKEIT